MNDQAATPLPDIIRDFPRVSPDVVKRASEYASSILADVAGRRGALDGRIAPLTPKTRIAGTAFTVEVRAGDNLMIHAAMQLAKPGDVLTLLAATLQASKEIELPLVGISMGPHGALSRMVGFAFGSGKHRTWGLRKVEDKDLECRIDLRLLV